MTTTRKIGIVEIEDRWIALKGYWLIIAIAVFVMGFYLPAIGFLCIVFQNTFHEIIHAMATRVYGGTVDYIFLSLTDHHIVFNVSPARIPTVFLWGAIFDTIMVSISSILFIASGGLFWGFLGVSLMGVLLYYMFIPESSDYRLSKRGYK